MFSYSSKTSRVLSEAGWFPGRQVDPMPFLEALRRAGYPTFPVVEQFLREYGGLRLLYENPFSPGRWQYAVLSPLAVVESADPDRLTDEYSRRAGELLTPIGSAASDYVILVMTISGRILATYDGEMNFLGIGEAGVEALCTKATRDVIP